MSMATVMDRGRGRGRGGPSRGGGRKGTSGGAAGVPLAAQMKQLQRLDEPKEMSVFRRFAKLGLATVESVYGPTGLLETKLRIPSANFKPLWGLQPSAQPTTCLSLVQGEAALRAIEAQESRDRALSRRAGRLPADRASADWSVLTDQEKELLLLSNAEFNRRYPNGRGAGGAGDDGEE